MNLDQTFHSMKSKLHSLLPESEIYLKAELVVEIQQLKKDRNAVILGHNYMEPALYNTVADIRGDSLELSRKACETKADVIVFCGVVFMAETAKILNPHKTVLVPSMKAGCSLASSITREDVKELKRRYPGVPVVSYINTYAEVKAETDICCTSSNAVKVVESLSSKQVLFIPDEYFARNIAYETGKSLIVPTREEKKVKEASDSLVEYEMLGWHGRCEVHDKYMVEDIYNIRKQFPSVVVLAHPESSREVCEEADFSGSTSQMIKFVQNHTGGPFLILTECSTADNIIAQNPEKDVLRLCSIRCKHMAQITLEMTRDALLYNQFEISVPEEIRIPAKASLDRMLAIQ